MASPQIFITGATGYVGGSILAKLLEPSQSGKWDITALVRSEDAVSKLKQMGVKTIIGSLENEELLIKTVGEADAVINTADSDNLAAVQSIIKGLKQSKRTHKIFLHNSGTAIMADMARGDYPSGKVYSDMKMDEIHAPPLQLPHRNVDDYIFQNSQGIQSIIICPPTIYGVGTGQFKRLSKKVPGFIKAFLGFLGFGYTATIGYGTNIWSHVHIEDLTNFYLLVLEKALIGQASTGKDGFYFCESGEHAWKDIVVRIAKELYKHNAIKQAEIGKYTTEEVDKYFGMIGWIGIGSNSCSSADKARKLGWKPKNERINVFDSITQEVEVMLDIKPASTTSCNVWGAIKKVFEGSGSKQVKA